MKSGQNIDMNYMFIHISSPKKNFYIPQNPSFYYFFLKHSK